MIISGLVKSSLIDYPGKLSAVIFTQGCNFRCGFCHNPDLVRMEDIGSRIKTNEVLAFLKTRVGKLDGVVITGGEPLIQLGIADFIADIKRLGFLVKLDTNGSNPEILTRLIDDKLIDYIAMDIKGPMAKYSEICAYSNTKVIQRSVDIVKHSGLDYAFRTTVLPHFHCLSDFEAIGRLIQGATRYTIQGFRPTVTLDKSLTSATVFSVSQLREFGDIMAPYVDKVVIHDNL